MEVDHARQDDQRPNVDGVGSSPEPGHGPADEMRPDASTDRSPSGRSSHPPPASG